jgi:predicted transcriptional regulator of viral defense system
MIDPIQNQIPREEFDYHTLLDVLKDYKHPRDKISDYLRKGVIIRIKKGLYIFGEDYRKKPYSRELLANLIYGPSYISLDYALQYYGFIPERVEAVTSVTTGRSRRFETPVGLFTYREIPARAFRFGMTRVESGKGSAFLIAIAEKALADKIRSVRGTGIKTLEQMDEYLYDDLRIDASALKELDPLHFEEIARRYRSRKIRLLADLIHRIRMRDGGNCDE